MVAVNSDVAKLGATMGFLNHIGAPQTVTATNHVVSALVPTCELYPNGNDCQGWWSFNAHTPTGRMFGIRDILRARSSRQAHFVERALSRLLHKHLGAAWTECYAPPPPAFGGTLAYYDYFALSGRGISFGFTGGGACGWRVATLSYKELNLYLSRWGRRLALELVRSA
jgi:hypothetical protein